MFRADAGATPSEVCTAYASSSDEIAHLGALSAGCAGQAKAVATLRRGVSSISGRFAMCVLAMFDGSAASFALVPRARAVLYPVNFTRT